MTGDAQEAALAAPAAPATLALPTDPETRRLIDLTGFAAEIALWQAFGRHLRIILEGDGKLPGLSHPDVKRRFSGLGGKPTVNRSFIPDAPPWPAVWPEAASPEQAVQLKALKLHLERLRAVHADLALAPATGVKFGDRVADLPGYLIPLDYDVKIEAAAARLAVIDQGVAAATTFLPALPESTRPLLPELAWPPAREDLKLVDGKGVEVKVLDRGGREVPLPATSVAVIDEG